MTTIQPGDVVEAAQFMPPSPHHTYPIFRGTRTIVAAISEPGHCALCGQASNGLFLPEFPLPKDRAWCPHHWRKVGGGIEETKAKFAEDLKIRIPLLDHETVIGQTSQDLLQTTLTRCDKVSH